MYKVIRLETTDNLFTRGWSALVLIGYLYYWFDLRDTPDAGTECMAFRCNAKGRVTNWHELYCRRGLPVSSESLMGCIREFAEEQADG